MKIEKNHFEWKEITTKIIKVSQRWDSPTFDQTVKEWIESSKKIGLYKNHRKVCGCCHIPWEKLPGKIVFVATNKGNKIICEKCWSDIN